MNKREVYGTIAGATVGVLGLVGVFSLISYQPGDLPGVLASADEIKCSNICGVYGLWFAHYLFHFFGFASYLFVILMVMAGFSFIGAIKMQPINQKLSGAVLFFLATCGWLGMIDLSEKFYSWSIASYGGVIGFYIHDAFIIKVGFLGEILFLLLASFMGLFLALEDKLLIGINAIFRGSVSTIKNINIKPLQESLSLGGLKNENDLELASESASLNRVIMSDRVPAKADNKVLVQSERGHSIKVEDSKDDEAIVEEEVIETPTRKKSKSKEAKLAQAEEEAAAAEEAESQMKEARKKQAAMAAALAVQNSQTKNTNELENENFGLVDNTPVQNMKGNDRAYQLPPHELLDPPIEVEKESQVALEERAIRLIETLSDFGISSELVSIVQGPVVTLYEISIGKGIRVQKILSLPDNIAMAMMAESVRIIAPLPGKNTIGIEIPNAVKEGVRMLGLIQSKSFDRKKYTLPFVIGKDAAGVPLISDITRMPHVLIAGATGSGKSVCLNSLIVSLLMFCRPEELKMVMIDPKMVEMKGYEGLPHLSMPVVVDMKKATAVFERLVEQMEKRYRVLSRVGVRNIASYNSMKKEDIIKKLSKYEEVDEKDVQLPMPYVVVVVDELADLMMSAPKEVEICITRLAQKSRAVGIHIVLATQRPSVDVVTGLIKSNMPTRLSFQTASKIDSRTILDQQGAEGLLGMGDMLFMPPGSSKLVRAQGVYLSDDEINKIIDHCVSQSKPQYDDELVNAAPVDKNDGSEGELSAEDADLFDKAVQIVLETQRGSASLLQRKLSLGYNRATKLIEMMEEKGIIGPHKGSVARDIYMTLEEWEAMKSGEPLP